MLISTIRAALPSVASPRWVKRNDALLELLPIGVMHFPGTGIQDNLADKAKRLGIPVWKFGGA
ncbi:hypothetical protein FXV83_27870 [Bradyrhizobium hipponense]|uniref:Uncharacterized protein n=1 Tax=Bradyrhizobium hipponense TaxID=2605638 RepID=A0A5S4YH74_9BRAD|nr:hypothetical protein [Bradyrhizobium hipponense]TYO63372.1 hypothetical protein FXV83_27870 [Bradyrhizobium hipponense]